MSQKLKVNVTFPLEVPIKTDRVGRRLSLTNQVSEYIDGYFADLRVNQLWGKQKEMKLSPGADESDMEIYEKITSIECQRAVEEREAKLKKWASNSFQERESQQEWAKAKDKECMELLGCSWLNFKTLSWDEQQKMREEHGVVWKDGKWAKGK